MLNFKNKHLRAIQANWYQRSSMAANPAGHMDDAKKPALYKSLTFNTFHFILHEGECNSSPISGLGTIMHWKTNSRAQIVLLGKNCSANPCCYCYHRRLAVGRRTMGLRRRMRRGRGDPVKASISGNWILPWHPSLWPCAPSSNRKRQWGQLFYQGITLRSGPPLTVGFCRKGPTECTVFLHGC